MASRDLPARPHLDHLKYEAKALHQAFRAGDANAIHRVGEALGDTSALKLTDARRVIAREYGFSTWAQLCARRFSRSVTSMKPLRRFSLQFWRKTRPVPAMCSALSRA